MNNRKKVNFKVINLIKEVKKHDMLYDWGSASYRNQTLKEQKWKDIGEIIGMGGNECRKKWRTLRDTYKKTKQRDKSRSDIATTRPWKYSKYLTFLDGCKSRYKKKFYSAALEPDSAVDSDEDFIEKNESNTDDNKKNNGLETVEKVIFEKAGSAELDFFQSEQDHGDLFENGSFPFLDEEHIEPHELPAKKQKLDIETCFIATMNSVQDFLKRPRNQFSDDSEDELFCRSMMRKLKKFPLQKKNEAKISILRYLSVKESDLNKQTLS